VPGSAKGGGMDRQGAVSMLSSEYMVTEEIGSITHCIIL
jgi:hypothetical protein